MKLVVTGIKDGKITYLTGEEDEISVPEIVDRLSEINKILSNKSTSLECLETVKTDYDEALRLKAEEVKLLKASIDSDFEIFKKNLLKRKEEREAQLLKDEPDYEALEKEKAKLEALYNEAVPSGIVQVISKENLSATTEINKAEAELVIKKEVPETEEVPKKKKIIF